MQNGLAMIQKHPPDLIVMDISLPEWFPYAAIRLTII
jgi:hypothetical protein